MKLKSTLPALFLLLAVLFMASHGHAQTAFTYQGQLRDGSTNANGNYSLTFKLFDNATGGTQIGSTLTAPSQSIVNGLFILAVDFGGAAFDGNARWLEITVQAGISAAETLAPRVAVLPAPYALFAKVAGTVTNGAIMNAQLAANAIATTNIQNSAITTALIANGAVTNQNLTANAVATTNIQNNAITTTLIADGAVTDGKVLGVSGSKVSGAVALATNAFLAGSANELHTSLTFSNSGTSYTTYWDVYPAAVASPGIVPHDLVFSANGAAQMVIRPNGLGAFINGLPISPIPNIQVFSGNGTFTVPRNVTRIMVEMWGGGGGGGSGVGGSNIFGNGGSGGYGAGGGGGGYGKDVVNVTPGNNLSVTVGSGGLGGLNGDAGISGGISSLGSLISATGGNGGQARVFGSNNSPNGGSGGTSSAADNVPGVSGSRSGGGGAGNGGSAARGSGGVAVSGGSGSSGIGPGCGGAGGSANAAYTLGPTYSSNTDGGSGASGRVIISY